MKFDLNKALENYRPKDKKEKECVEKTKEFLRISDNCFNRTNLKGHITAGALVMDEDGNVLLNHHKILDKWLLFGGHSDGDSNSLNVAKREVMEECGIVEVDDLDGKILDVDAHMIPENISKKEPAHYHYDIRFLFIVKDKKFKISDESKEAQWMSMKQAKKLMKDPDKIRVLDKAYEIYIDMQREK